MVDELDEAKQHFEDLTNDMVKSKVFNEEDFKVQLAHVYAHLNRAWNARNSCKGIVEENWDEISKFPNDIEPMG